tara:strand:- start:9506 stop:9880 length:375 start_codon:yes stop_codon:yes gene_type:complete
MTNSKSIAAIQFIKGIDELITPEITIKRSHDGKRGKAYFVFNKPNFLSLESPSNIKSMVLLDNEGELITRQINFNMINDNKFTVEAIYSWGSDDEFKRFMRFAINYAIANEIGYNDKVKGGYPN